MAYKTLAVQKNTANFGNSDAAEITKPINRAFEHFRPVFEANMAKDEVENAKKMKIEKREKVKFSTLIIRLARKKKITGMITFDPVKFSLAFVKNKKTIHLSLSNLQKLQLEIGKNEFESGVNHLLQATMETFEPFSVPSFDDIKERLVPLVRNRFLTDNACWGKDGPDAENRIEFHTPSDDAVILLGLDGQKTTAVLSKQNLEQWNVSYADAMKEAMNNLRSRTACNFKKIAPGVFRSSWIDDYDSSRILLPEVIESANVDGTPVFMIPTCNCLLVTAKENLVGQREMIEIALAVMRKERQTVSTNLYIFQDGVAIEFIPEDTEAKKKLADIKYIIYDNDYAQQRKIIQEFNLINLIDIFVAEYFLIENKQSGETLSGCALAEGVCQLLPKTEVIALFMPSASPGEFIPIPKLVKWADIAEILSDTMEKLDGYPTRYRVWGYPTPDQFHSLKSVAENFDERAL